jgi:hypothetical protein
MFCHTTAFLSYETLYCHTKPLIIVLSYKTLLDNKIPFV